MREKEGLLYPENEADAYTLVMTYNFLIESQWEAIKVFIPNIKFNTSFTENGGSATKSGKFVRPKNKKGHDQSPKP